MEHWIEIRKGGNFEEIGKKLGVSPVIIRLLINRGIKDEEMDSFLFGEPDDLGDPFFLSDMEKAYGILLKKMKEQKKIRVIGDYDIDGVCSTYILLEALRNSMEELGGERERIDYMLPHRVIDGYGLNRHLIDQAVIDQIDTIITCDNGIAASQEIDYAKELGMTVIVTDHHEVPFHEENGVKVSEIPKADAIINPKRLDSAYPFRELCGAGVAYKIAEVLYQKILKKKIPNDFIEMAAFATIGDVMPLVGENRLIVKSGLQKMVYTCNIGLHALIKQCELDEKTTLSPYHVGFILGPCMNASGRLDTAKTALELLLSRDEEEAERLARELRQLNEDRKKLTEAGVEEAEALLDSQEKLSDVLVVYLPNSHESIAGIIAGRIRERYNRPVFVLTATTEGVKGSGRSIDEYDMYAGLLRCREMFSKFGGHKLAAGLSMDASTEKERETCAEALNNKLNENTGLLEEMFVSKYKIDMVLPFTMISEKLIEELKLLEPCGMGNVKPVFATRGVSFYDGKVFGKNKNVFKCIACDDSGKKIDAVLFGETDQIQELSNNNEKCSILYYPEINEFRGNRTIQIIIQNIKGK